jgi:hypothetical protein
MAYTGRTRAGPRGYGQSTAQNKWDAEKEIGILSNNQVSCSIWNINSLSQTQLFVTDKFILTSLSGAKKVCLLSEAFSHMLSLRRTCYCACMVSICVHVCACICVYHKGDGHQSLNKENCGNHTNRESNLETEKAPWERSSLWARPLVCRF